MASLPSDHFYLSLIFYNVEKCYIILYYTSWHTIVRIVVRVNVYAKMLDLPQSVKKMPQKHSELKYKLHAIKCIAITQIHKQGNSNQNANSLFSIKST